MRARAHKEKCQDLGEILQPLITLSSDGTMLPSQSYSPIETPLEMPWSLELLPISHSSINPVGLYGLGVKP